MLGLAAGGPGSAAVLPRLWAANREALLRGLVALYEKDPANTPRVLEVCQVGPRPPHVDSPPTKGNICLVGMYERDPYKSPHAVYGPSCSCAAF